MECLETFLVSSTEEGTTDVYWVEARDGAKHSKCTGWSLKRRITWTKTSTILRLRKPAINCKATIEIESFLQKLTGRSKNLHGN